MRKQRLKLELDPESSRYIEREKLTTEYSTPHPMGRVLKYVRHCDDQDTGSGISSQRKILRRLPERRWEMESAGVGVDAVFRAR